MNPQENAGGKFLLALVRLDLAETMTEALLVFLNFNSQTMAEYAALRDGYRASVARIDARYQADAAIRKARFEADADGSGS
jgi:hypothetical protein